MNAKWKNIDYNIVRLCFAFYMFFRKLKYHFLPTLAQKKMDKKWIGLQRDIKKLNLCQLYISLTQDVRRDYTKT
jgi:hypothetical protein